MGMNQARSGFSLVELSIVLVILGLLVGGILGGQNLIRAAELRTVVTEYQQWQTAAYTFKERYLALPGDMPNAIDVWGKAPACAGSVGSVLFADEKTCNGNGDGSLIGGGSTDTQASAEHWLFWQHLANAKIISGTYNGKSGGGAYWVGVPGEAIPTAKIGGVWRAFSSRQITDGFDSYRFGDVFALYTPDNPASGLFGNSGVISPDEAWGIDKKMDDGSPTKGKIASSAGTDCTGKADGATGATTASDIDAQYNMSGGQKSCILYFAL